jgi:hypothetical protein
MTGANGKATSLATTGTYGPSLGVTPFPTLTVALDSSKSVNDVIAEINGTLAYPLQPTAGSSYLATAGYGRNTTTVGSSQRFDFNMAVAGGSSCPSNNTVDIIGDMDEEPMVKTRLFDNAELLSEAINSQSSFTTYARATSGVTPAETGCGLPRFIPDTVPLYFSGGTPGISAASEWQAAFDLLLQYRVNQVVPLAAADVGTVPIEAIYAMAVSHVQTARGIGRNERDAFLGWTPSNSVNDLTNLLAVGATMNDPDIGLLFQSPTLLDVDSNLKKYEPWGQALLFAGMEAGAPIGEPLTWKYVKQSGMDNNSNYLNVDDNTTANRLDQGGILYAYYKRGKGYRWNRGLSTWLGDDNLANTDLSVRGVLRYMAYDLRTSIEDRFTGTRAVPANVARIKSHVVATCQGYKDDGIIVDSIDPDTGARQNAFYGVTVTVCGDIAKIAVNVFPVCGINYETLEIDAQIPTINA